MIVSPTYYVNSFLCSTHATQFRETGGRDLQERGSVAGFSVYLCS